MISCFSSIWDTKGPFPSILLRGSWGGPRMPEPPPHPVVSLILRNQATIFRWRKCYDNILTKKGFAEKPTCFRICFVLKSFRQRLLFQVKMALYDTSIQVVHWCTSKSRPGGRHYNLVTTLCLTQCDPPPEKILASPLQWMAILHLKALPW